MQGFAAFLMTLVLCCLLEISLLETSFVVAQSGDFYYYYDDDDDKVCSDEFFNTYFNGTCFYFESDRISRNEARFDCEGKGGTLASIHSQEEQEFLNEQYRRVGFYGIKYWIGLRISSFPESYEWLDETVVDYENFKDGEPSSSLHPYAVANSDADVKSWESEATGTMREGFVCSLSFEDTLKLVEEKNDDKDKGRFPVFPVVGALLGSALVVLLLKIRHEQNTFNGINIVNNSNNGNTSNTREEENRPGALINGVYLSPVSDPPPSSDPELATATPYYGSEETIQVAEIIRDP